jgi:hypothetical protein
MWFVARSAVLKGLEREATFLIAIPTKAGFEPKSWAYWRKGANFQRIGPRHTNFGDGSICAFSPADGVWSDGGDLTTLVDLYSVWALRHLHLEVRGRWPGKQYTLVGANPLAQAYYRSRECRDDELCACGSETKTYTDCCKKSDGLFKFTEMVTAFLREAPDGFPSRCPPAAVTDFITGRSALPRIRDVHQRMVREQAA